MKRLVVLVIAVTLLAGCDPIERQAYNTVVAAKAFLDSIKAQHPECATATTSKLCSNLSRATSAKDLIIDAGQAYCHVDQFENTSTVPCNPSASGPTVEEKALAALKSALAGYDQAEKDLRGVIR